MGPKWSQMVHQFPGRTDNELKNFWNSRNRKYKKSYKQPFVEFLESMNSDVELNENKRESYDSQKEDNDISNMLVDQSSDGKNNEKIIMRGSTNHSNNVCQEEEPTLPRVEFNHQDIMHGKYLDQVNDDKNINNLKQLSTLVDDSNMLYNNEESATLGDR
ncbi:unnamed protein product [Lathyrus sativus]|nr:unnamed protein product [Lathyrus sativus]